MNIEIELTFEVGAFELGQVLGLSESEVEFAWYHGDLHAILARSKEVTSVLKVSLSEVLKSESYCGVRTSMGSVIGSTVLKLRE